ETRAEIAAAGPAEVAHADTGSLRVSGVVLGEHREDGPDEAPGSPQPPGTVGRPLEDRIPGEVVDALARELDAVREPAVPRLPQRVRGARVRTGRGGQDGRGDQRHCPGAQHQPAIRGSRPNWRETLATALILPPRGTGRKTSWSASGQANASRRPSGDH